MGKGARLKKKRRQQVKLPGERFTELLTKNFQKEIRNSEIWEQTVAEFGEEKTKQLLEECKDQVAHGEKI